MNYRFTVICWMIVSVALFTLVGFIVSQTGSLWALWFVILPFLMSIKSKETDGESHG